MSGKTYVLVHGGFHGGWCWRSVTVGLRALGHTVYRPTLTGLGERSHLLSCRPTLETWIEDIAQVIRFEELEAVILVGHSFAGPIISALADRMPARLRHLVFLDAQVLESGESPATRNPKLVERYLQKALAAGDGAMIPPPDPVYLGIVEPAMAREVAAKLTPHPLNTYHDKLWLDHPLGNGVPASYIACTQPLFPATEKARDIARRMAGWQYQEIPCGHDAMLLMPGELTSMLAAID